ncbi:MAG: hypothetical protein ACYDAC_08340 [Candidatus Dormibacteria bacterium]
MPNLAAPAAAAGAADTALFVARRPALFREAPGRAAGSVAVGVLWGTLAARSLRDGEHARGQSLGLAALLLAANGAMLAAHLRHGIRSPRVYGGAALSALAFGDTLRRLR